MILILLTNNDGNKYCLDVSGFRIAVHIDYTDVPYCKSKISFHGDNKYDAFCQETPEQVYELILKAEKIFVNEKKVSRNDLLDLD